MSRRAYRKLHGKTSLVTGGARGIGFETARRLVEAGVTTTIWDLDAEGLETAREELVRSAPDHEDGVFACRCDVTDPVEVESAVDRAQKEMGRIDILINNAGALAGGPFATQDPEAQRAMIDVNFTAVVTLTRLVLPLMHANETGHVVNIASAASTVGVPDLAVYTATKWAVWGFTESLRHESLNEGRRGLRFSSVHPNYVATGLFEGARIPGVGGILFPRVGSHDEVARVVVEKCLVRGRRQVLMPPSVRFAILLRALLPYPLFLSVARALGVHRSMASWHGYSSE
jgi:all-trans-retinol dehydrogenase (NAD+)